MSLIWVWMKLYFLGAYDIISSAGDSTVLFQLVFYVESPAFLN